MVNMESASEQHTVTASPPPRATLKSNFSIRSIVPEACAGTPAPSVSQSLSPVDHVDDSDDCSDLDVTGDGAETPPLDCSRNSSTCSPGSQKDRSLKQCIKLPFRVN